jgi:hypothetical protein
MRSIKSDFSMSSLDQTLANRPNVSQQAFVPPKSLTCHTDSADASDRVPVASAGSGAAPALIIKTKAYGANRKGASVLTLRTPMRSYAVIWVYPQGFRWHTHAGALFGDNSMDEYNEYVARAAVCEQRAKTPAAKMKSKAG